MPVRLWAAAAAAAVLIGWRGDVLGQLPLWALLGWAISVLLVIAARARMDERARIAGEMHDMLGHRLSLLSVHAGALELRAAEAEALREQARLVRTTAVVALAELRQILQLTRGLPGADAGTEPVVGSRADLDALVERSREAGLNVGLTWTGDDLRGVDQRVRQAVHRTVREGLTNVHTHAPSTPVVTVAVTVDRGRAAVTVTNAAPVSGARSSVGTGRGLVGLEERAALLGGRCHGRPRPDGGFRLELDVPTTPAGVVAALPETPAPAGSPEPPPLGEAEVLSTRRMVVLVVLAVLFLVPIALLTLTVVVGLLQGIEP